MIELTYPKQLSFKHHPDRNLSVDMTPLEKQAKAQEYLKIQQAYTMLKDPVLRSLVDTSSYNPSPPSKTQGSSYYAEPFSFQEKGDVYTFFLVFTVFSNEPMIYLSYAKISTLIKHELKQCPTHMKYF